MKKIHLLLTAAAGLFVASCVSDDFVSIPQETPGVETESPILFNTGSKGMTRADLVGADAAAKLGNKFVVAGKKGATTAATNSNVVFDNYEVVYKENTANTTESNSSNWEYVGKGRIKHAIDNGITSQTIKYWDYSQPQYDFIAWSTGNKTAVYDESELAAGKVYVSAINPNATATGAYTFKGSAADLSACYIADLVTVKKTQYGDDPVTFRFRQLGTKVRIGIYETVPGYSVRNVKFYQTAGLLTDPATEITTTPALFTTTANDIYTSGTYTVTFPTVDDPSKADNNQAHVTFTGSGTQSTVVEWGGLNYTIAEEGEQTPGSVYLGRTSNTASYAGNAADDYYVIFLPNENGTNLNLRVDFTLESIDGGGEVIEVKNAKAQVPSIYTTWKPGFAYTYLFKISDKTNGRTGVYDPTQADDATINSDPAGLYPITFDAMVVNAEDNNQTQETITTVMTPSITSYQQASTVVNANEYTANGNDIFVTVNEGDALVTMTNANPIVNADAALYTIPDGKTEAEVVDALSMQDDDAAAGTVKGRSGLVLTEATFTLTNSVEFGADGNAISVGTDQAVRFTPTAATTYAFVYTKTAPTATTDNFQPVTKAAGDAVNGFYRYALVAAPAGDTQKGVKYFPANDASAGMITAFIGQGVGNLYTRSGAGTDADPYVYSIASGYAATGTTYYYTTDKGMTYKAAHNVAYADFASATDLYTFDGTSYTLKTDAAPVDGTAYYQKTTDPTLGDIYTYCVILPQQTTGLFVIDEAADKVACGSTDTAVNGMTYFDKYTKNNGEYYVKVIKVQ